MKLAVGVHLEGTFHFAREGDRNTPSYVCPDSLKIIGRPDLVALWIADIDVADALNRKESRATFLEDLASQLRDHHEESDI